MFAGLVLGNQAGQRHLQRGGDETRDNSLSRAPIKPAARQLDRLGS